MKLLRTVNCFLAISVTKGQINEHISITRFRLPPLEPLVGPRDRVTHQPEDVPVPLRLGREPLLGAGGGHGHRDPVGVQVANETEGARKEVRFGWNGQSVVIYV